MIYPRRLGGFKTDCHFLGSVLDQRFKAVDVYFSDNGALVAAVWGWKPGQNHWWLMSTSGIPARGSLRALRRRIDRFVCFLLQQQGYELSSEGIPYKKN